MRQQKHLSLSLVPMGDIEALCAAYVPADLFDETGGPGTQLAEGSRNMIMFAYRRWLGFLYASYPHALAHAPADRITQERVREFVHRLSADMGFVSLAICMKGLCYAGRFLGPGRDWQWLASIAARLHARDAPADRFDRLIPGWNTLDHGLELMDQALTLAPDGHQRREIQYRDGLLLIMLSLWPIRRRSIATLTVSRHLEFDEGGVNILFWPEDTKCRRPESCRLDERAVPYLKHYVRKIRPELPGSADHDGLWASYKKRPLTAGRIYDIARARTARRFGKAMSLHDFRRAAATFLATDAPTMVGLIPGVLQHASPEIGEEYYNLSRSIEASRRHAASIARAREDVRLLLERR